MPSDLVHLTERQQKWFASVRASLTERTGKTLEQWVAIAKTCPHDSHGARVKWLKAEHGLLQNSAAFVLGEAFPKPSGGWDDAAGLRAALWADVGSLAVLEAVERVAADVPGLVSGQRKAFTAFSRAVQFAAMRPVKAGGALLALKLDPETSARLTPWTRKEAWSDRLVAAVELPGAGAVDAEVAALFAEAAGNG